MLKTACFIFSLPLWRWFTVHLWKRPATLQLLLCYTFSLISSSLHSMLLCFIAVHFINQNTFTSFYAIMPKLHICQDRKLRNKKFHFLVRTNKRFTFKITLFSSPVELWLWYKHQGWWCKSWHKICPTLLPDKGFDNLMKLRSLVSHKKRSIKSKCNWMAWK